MGATGMLHLRFEPPATEEQLDSLHAALDLIDHGYCPDRAEFTPTGTTGSKPWHVVGDCRWAFWWKPVHNAEEVVRRELDRLGLRGFGWFWETYHEVDQPPRHSEWFAFGGHPFQEQIDADATLSRLQSDYYTAKRAVEVAAHGTDDLALLDAAATMREAKARLDAARSAPADQP